MDSNTSATAAARPCWKVDTANGEQHTKYIPLHHARQFFAVDASGSTAGTVIAREHEFVTKLHDGHPHDRAALWGSDCEDPADNFPIAPWRAASGGTQPSRILHNQRVLDTIAASDLWYLLTDGEIWGDDVQRLCGLAVDTGVLNVPTIFVITGTRGSSRPSDLNVSVGISFFANAQHVLILFKESSTGHLYIIAAKGCFAALDSNTANTAPDLSSWTPLKELFSERDLIQLLRTAAIQVPTAETRPSLVSGTISLGEEWEKWNPNTVVDLDLLVTAGGKLTNTDLEQLLDDAAFGNLSLAFKTRGRIQDLRSFVMSQKVDEINLRLEDISGARALIARLSDQTLDANARDALQLELREAHARNRHHYQDAVKRLKESGEHQAARNRNTLVNFALEQLAAMESSTYTANILARPSNRARRAAMVTGGGEISVQSLDLETPNAFRGDCHICCGENEVMSISLKAGADAAANTDNFALDFPLAAGRFNSNKDVISSQLVCFQCALAFEGRSLFKEDVAAVLPAVDCHESNKKYIHEQLHLALTGGLRVGASGTSQLFMTILDRTLREKEWAGAGSEMALDAEVAQRRDLFRWVLANLLERTGCRETFNEQGQWVTYSKALAWAAKDFREQGLDSWAVGYPTAGFMQLIRFGRQLEAFDAQTARDLRLAKVLHSVASAYLAQLYKNMHTGNQAWKQPLLALIYAEFNGDLVPTDKRGYKSVLGDSAVFWERLSAFLTADVELLADWDAADMERAMRRVQVLTFWLVYLQRDHTRAKTYFQKLRNEQPLSHAVLDPHTADPLAPSVTHPTLLSIFRGDDTTDPTTLALRARHTGGAPFFTPFGPSVLRCCYPACQEQFLPAEQLAEVKKLAESDAPWPARVLDQLRQARANHLTKVFATDARAFAAESQTGLPAVTASPAPPHSMHYNLHVSIARAWSRIADAEGEGDDDAISAVDRKRRIAAAVRDGGAAEELVTFVEEVKREVCKSRRGDVFQELLDEDTKLALPSFLESLRAALRLEQKQEGDVDVAAYVHDWEKNKLEDKLRWELRREEAGL
ncbi:mg754 protein [Diplodia corticola]|uniref:Mg754 protein n=1 Tax=Diplodia corticola TaxID=236234 RepID=A0A1J9QPR4_9PEZI|nr:mg754 protein [Diplodia corticola]OJD30449.1 mg754 protein [Diplodia corticola]